MDINNITLTGRLTSDAEVAERGASVVANFSIANNTGFGDSKKVQYFDCALWGKRAESLKPYLLKGQAVGVVGRIEANNYTKQDGSTVKGFKVVVTDVTLMGGGNRDEKPIHIATKQNSYDTEYEVGESYDVDEDELRRNAEKRAQAAKNGRRSLAF